MRTTLFFFLFIFLVGAKAFGQNQSIGFIQSEITGIKISSDTENSSQLLIEGDPISDSFNYTVRRVEGTNNVFRILLPNAIIDPENFKEEFLRFEDKIIEKIEKIEKVDRENELFTLTFEITTRNPASGVVSFFNEEEIRVNFVSQVVPAGPLPVPEFGEYSQSPQIEYNEDGTPYFPTQDFSRNKGEPAALYVSIVNAGGKNRTAEELAIFLNGVMKSEINKRIGMQLNIFQISDKTSLSTKKTTIYFRDNFMKPALIIADVIPGNQRVKRLINPNSKQGIHVEIFLGSDFD